MLKVLFLKKYVVFMKYIYIKGELRMESNYDDLKRDSIVSKFACNMINANIKKFTIKNNRFVVTKGHKYSINNQNSELRYTNFFEREFEFMIEGCNLIMPISIQLYNNNRDHYRIFVFNNKGMLTSVNLTTGYTDGEINLEIQLKLSTRDMTKETRQVYKELMISDIENEGVDIIKKDTVYFGRYDTVEDTFIDTTPNKFLEQLIKVAVIKGHYMKNKGYSLNIL